MSSDPILISEVARICGVDEAAVQAWIEQKKLRVIRDPITGIAHVRRDTLAVFLRKLNFPRHVVHLVLRRRYLTTGEVAKICEVAPRTVSRWFDSGLLKGFRIPGSNDRRIPREELARFLKEKGMPLGELERELHRAVLFVGGRKIFEEAQRLLRERGSYACEFADSALDAVFEISERKCQVAVIDLEVGRNEAVELVDRIRYRVGSAIWLIAIAAEDETDPEFLLKAGFNDVVKKPIDIGNFVSKVHSFFERP